MCAIVDANIANEVFGANRIAAARKFFDWLNTGAGILIAGGELLNELNITKYREWVKQARLSGKLKVVDYQAVEARTTKLYNKKECKSDDHHVIALAQVSGARLLYTNDGDLIEDFKNKKLIDKPRGRVYTTNESEQFTASQRKLLARKDLCMNTRN